MIEEEKSCVQNEYKVSYLFEQMAIVSHKIDALSSNANMMMLGRVNLFSESAKKACGIARYLFSDVALVMKPIIDGIGGRPFQ